jgi:hypothetical protein
MFEILKFLSIFNYYQPHLTLRLRPISEVPKVWSRIKNWPFGAAGLCAAEKPYR